MLFEAFKRTIAFCALATPNAFLPKIVCRWTRGRISVPDAAELYLAMRFAFACALASVVGKSQGMLWVVAVIQVTSFVYLLKILFPVAGRGLKDPSRSLFFSFGHYIELGLSMAYVYWVLDAFGGDTPATRAESVYFSFVTMTTIGFGDFTPKTEGARLLVAAHGFVGIFMLAIVIGLFLSLAAAKED